MSGRSEYQALQDRIRELQNGVGEIAAQIAAEADALRQVAEGALAIAERRVIALGPTLEAACELRGTTTVGRVSDLVARLGDLARAQEAAAEQFERLTAEERIGQIPPPVRQYDARG